MTITHEQNTKNHLIFTHRAKIIAPVTRTMFCTLIFLDYGKKKKCLWGFVAGGSEYTF